MATKLRYFAKEKTLQKQRGFYIANNLGSPLDVTTWVLFKENLSDIPVYVGKKVYVYTEDEIYYYNGSRWNQLYDNYSPITTGYQGDKTSNYRLKFYNLGHKDDDEQKDSPEKYFVALDILAKNPKTWEQGKTYSVGDIVRLGNNSTDFAKCIRPTSEAPFFRLTSKDGSVFTNNYIDEKGKDKIEYYSNYLNSNFYESANCIIRASLIIPAIFENKETYFIEYPSSGNNKGEYKLYYKWYRNSFTNNPFQTGYSNTWKPNYSDDDLKKMFNEKICVEVFIEKPRNEKVLVARNSFRIVSESYLNSVKGHEGEKNGVLFLTDKTPQIPRGYINTNKLDDGSDSGSGFKYSGIDLSSVAQTVNKLDKFSYLGKETYVYEDDSFYFRRLKGIPFIPTDENYPTVEDKIQYINSLGSYWNKVDDKLTKTLRYTNISNLNLNIDGSEITYINIDNDRFVDTSTPYWGYRKMSYRAHLDLDFIDRDSSIALDGLEKIFSNYRPVNLEYYDIDASVLWSVKLLTEGADGKEKYEDITVGVEGNDASNCYDPSSGKYLGKTFIMPTSDQNVRDYNGDRIVSDPTSFNFEFGVTNDIYDQENLEIRCDISFNTETNRETISKSFNLCIERKSYIEFSSMKMTEITPLVGKFHVEGRRIDWSNDSSISSDASQFFSLKNDINFRYKVFYSLVNNSESKWFELDSRYIEFVQDTENDFHFTRKIVNNKVVEWPEEMRNDIKIDNGKLPFGCYRIVPFINNVEYNLRYGTEDFNIIEMFQNVSKFALRTNEYGEDTFTEKDGGEYKGKWNSSLKIKYGDSVMMNGEIFRCINPNGSTNPPLKNEDGVNEDWVIDKTSIKVGYFDASKVDIRIKSGIKDWFDLVYTEPVDRGEWYDGIRLRYKDIVSVDGKKYQCINENGTKNYPLERFMTNTCRPLMFNDMDYVLTGEKNTEDFSETINWQPSLNKTSIPKDTILTYNGNYYKTLSETLERPYIPFLDSEENELLYNNGEHVISNIFNSGLYKVDRTERFEVEDKSSSLPVKKLIVQGFIEGSYIDMDWFTYPSSRRPEIVYRLIEDRCVRMPQDSHFFSKIEYELIFDDDRSSNYEMISTSIKYATNSNPLNDRKEVTNEAFVYHPYASPTLLDMNSLYHKLNGADIFLAETNGYRFRTSINDFKVEYDDEDNKKNPIDKVVSYYVGGVKIKDPIENTYSSYPVLKLGDIIEARMNFDSQGIVGGTSNCVGLKSPYPIYQIDFDFELEDGVVGLVEPGKEYIVDLKVRETIDSSVFLDINSEEYVVEVWTVNNDVYVGGTNIKNNKTIVNGSSFNIIFKSPEMLSVDLYAKLYVYGGNRDNMSAWKNRCFKKEVFHDIPVETRTPEHEGFYNLDEIIDTCDINISEINRPIKHFFDMADIITSIDILFGDGTRKIYDTEMVQRMLDSGRIYFQNTVDCVIEKNRIYPTAVNPSFDIRFNGWDDRNVKNPIRPNFHTEFEYIGFKPSITSSAKVFELYDDLERVDGGGDFFSIYMKGLNLKSFFNMVKDASLGLSISSYIDSDGQMMTNERKWLMNDVSTARFNFNSVVSDDDTTIVVCSFPYKSIQDSSGNFIDKNDIGFNFESEDDIRRYGYIKIAPKIDFRYYKDGSSYFENVGFDYEFSNAKIAANTIPSIRVMSSVYRGKTYCTVKGGGRYPIGTDVSLMAIPNEGCTFRRWLDTEDVYSMKSVCDTSIFVYTVEGDKTFYAKCLPEILPEYHVMLDVYDSSAGFVAGSGIYTPEDNVIIDTSAASDEYIFKYWASLKGDEIVYDTPRVEIGHLASNVDLIAVYAKVPKVEFVSKESDDSSTDFGFGIEPAYMFDGNKLDSISKIDEISITTFSNNTEMIIYYKIYTETNYDFLKIYFDDVEILKETGSNGNYYKINKVVKNIEIAGRHRLVVKYIKDFSITAGDDKQYYTIKFE